MTKQEIFNLSQEEYFKLMKVRVKNERQSTNDVVEMVFDGLLQRRFAGHAPSMHEWLTKEFGYTKGAAQRRIDAARLIGALPEMESELTAKLETGVLSLSTLSKVQSAIRCQEIETRKKVSKELKIQIVQDIENKTILEAEQILCKHLSANVSSVHQERKMVINENVIRYSLNFSTEATENLKRAKDLLSHKFPNGSDADVIAYALNFLLDKTDPLRKIEKESHKNYGTQKLKTNSPDNPRSPSSKLPVRKNKSIARKVYREVLKRSDGKCTYKHPDTGKICGSSFQIQLDHLIPRALGGTNESSNLRLLCRQHNLLEAEKVFGKRKMEQYRLPGI